MEPIRRTPDFGHTMRRSLFYAALVLIALVSVVPLLWALTSSLRPDDEIFRYTTRLSWKTLLPIGGTIHNFREILFEDRFARFFGNSLLVAGATILLGLLVNSLAAFGFARFTFPGQRVLFGFVLVTFMVPFEVIVLPLYLVVRSLGWLDTYRALIIPAVPDAFSIFLIRQFMAKLPRDMFEAGRVDGASWWDLYWRVALPNVKPALITASLLLFLRQWDAFFWPLVATSSLELTVIQVALTKYMTEFVTYWGRLLAGSMLATLPIVAAFFLLQRYFVQSVTSSGIKG
ncbi:MAG TPA: carbohydrate ABC transporter permease [Candidatus Baltobacteraceae bacterium]|nr:carbohydrate ABC transporter permease [Candidatus Baltobacteraceae bacterium]